MAQVEDFGGRSFEFTVGGGGDDLQRGEALLVQRVEHTPEGTRVSVVPERVVREFAAQVLS